MNFSGASDTTNGTMRIYFRGFGITNKKLFFALFVEIIFFLLKYSGESYNGLPIWAKFLLVCTSAYSAHTIDFAYKS